MITSAPNSEYPALRRQFLALRTLANSQAQTMSWQRSIIDKLQAQLNPEELNSQRDANEQLTRDVAMLEAKLAACTAKSIEQFVQSVIETGELSGKNASFLETFAKEYLMSTHEAACQKSA